MSKTYILYNPYSGNGSGKAKAETFAATCGDAALLDLIEVCADYKALFDKTTAEDRVIICGGDGTLNRFVNEVEGLEIPCDILYYATGTGNDFLRDMGKEEGAAPFSVKEILQDLPIVTVNGKEWRFLNGVGYGIDGYCCEIGDQLRAKGDGKPINYTAIAIKGLLFHYKPTNARITVDGKVTGEELADFVAIQEQLEKISVAVETLQLWSERMLATGAIDPEAYRAFKAQSQT